MHQKPLYLSVIEKHSQTTVLRLPNHIPPLYKGDWFIDSMMFITDNEPGDNLNLLAILPNSLF